MKTCDECDALRSELRAAVDALRRIDTPGDLHEALDDVQDLVTAYDTAHPEDK
jgi:hypothetical protein